MSETVRNWLESMGPLGEELAADGNNLGFFVPQLLDATIYGICPTCGGTRTVPKPYGDDRDRGRTFSACPDCAERVIERPVVVDGKIQTFSREVCPDCTGTVSVVTKELRERAVQAIESTTNEWWERGTTDIERDTNEAYAIADAVLSTVLGKTRVALAVVRAGKNVSEVEGTVTTLSHDSAILEDDDE